jgi:hypothetical protein
MYRRTCVLLAVLSLVVIAGCTKKGSPTDQKGAGHKTPEEVFEAAKTAMTSGDYKTFVACLTPEAVDSLAGQLAFGAAFMKGFSALDKKGDSAKKFKPMFDVLDKHGLTDEFFKKNQVKMGKSKAENAKALRALGAKIKDAPVFVVDIMNASPAQQKKEMQDFGSAKLKDLKVDGDTAKATLVSKKQGKDKEEPIEFKKIDGSWKMDIGKE